MVLECIFLIVKFDVVVKNYIGVIYNCFEIVGFKIVVVKMVYFLKEKVEGFYVEYSECFFFGVLVEFMIFGLVMVIVFEGENVVFKNCEIMGVINFVEVLVGILCVDYVDSIDENVVYGLDVVELVVCEIVYFFVDEEICLCIC